MLAPPLANTSTTTCPVVTRITQVTRYQSSKCKLPYKEYLEMRRQV